MFRIWLNLILSALLLCIATNLALAKNCSESLSTDPAIYPTQAEFISCLKEIQREAQSKAASGISILNPKKISKSDSQEGNSAHSIIRLGPYETAAVVIAVASGHSTYVGNRGTSGIILNILVDGDQAAADDSLEAISENILYNASASHIFYLAQGETAEIEARVSPYGVESAINKNTGVNLNVIALAAQ